MAFEITIPFFAFRLHFHSGYTLLNPINEKSSIRIGQPLHAFSIDYQAMLQKKIFNQGDFIHLMNEYQEGDFFNDLILLRFDPAKDGFSFPAFEMEFVFYFNQRLNGIWAMVPSLGIEAYAKDLQTLKAHLTDAIKLDFARYRRLQAVQHIVSILWFDAIELNREELKFTASTPKELEELENTSQEAILPKVANLLKIDKTALFGRKEELNQLIRIIRGKILHNILLVGASGVGKTAMVWEFARQLKKQKIPYKIWETTASLLIKELTQEVGWQENLALLCRELAGSQNILYVSNLGELFEVGKYEGNSVSIADYLRTYISRGEVTIISECTPEELANIELKSPNFLSYFQIIRLEEPKEELEGIILNTVKAAAKKKNINIPISAVQENIRLNRRFAPYSGMPGKPIRFLENLLINKVNNTSNKGKAESLNKSEVIRYFCEESGMPLFMVDPSIPMNVQRIKDDFNFKVFGQEKAVNTVVDLLASVKTALTRSGKPIASFLFVGPTGVGKTELAKVLAAFIFGSRDRLLRFDMSEFSSSYAVMRLIGLDYYSDGLLSSAVRREPFSILLFDEIEKAHPNFFDLLLQILSEGRLTDSKGKLVDFCSSVIIMTSNIGAESLQNSPIVLSSKQESTDVSEHFLSAVQKYFRPELFNRIDQVIPFNALDKSIVRLVVEREMELFQKREGIRFRNIHLEIKEEVHDHLANQGYNNKYGARQLQRTIRNLLILPLSRELNKHDFDDQLNVEVLVEDNQIKIQSSTDPLGLELLLEELDKINHTDHASQLRRQIHNLREGHFYIRLLSEIDILEEKKSREKDNFWKNPSQVERYTHYLQIKSSVERLVEEVEAYEMDLSLAYLGLKTYQPKLVEKLEQWEEKFFDLKVEIFQQLYPDVNLCYLDIYGSDLVPVFQFYKALLDKKGFTYSAYSVWFRESFYNEEIFNGEEEKASQSIERQKKRKRQQYHKLLIAGEIENDSFEPEQKGDILYGIEFAINGNCAYPYLYSEQGSQLWKLEEDDEKIYVVRVNNQLKSTPSNIHRKEFYTKPNPRRYIEPGRIKDNLYKINREYYRSDLISFFEEHLNERFKTHINIELMIP